MHKTKSNREKSLFDNTDSNEKKNLFNNTDSNEEKNLFNNKDSNEEKNLFNNKGSNEKRNLFNNKDSNEELNLFDNKDSNEELNLFNNKDSNEELNLFDNTDSNEKKNLFNNTDSNDELNLLANAANLNMEDELQKARKQKVARRTDMILKGRFSLSNIENKAISYLISKVKPNDEKGKAYLFNCKEFQGIMRWSPKNSYNNTKGMLNRLADKGWWIETEENGIVKESYVHWITVLHMYPGTGNVVIKFHEDMFPYILDLTRQSQEDKNYFMSYALENIALMGHEYSPRVYDILKTYQFNHKSWVFEFGTNTERDLRIMIAHYETDPKKAGKAVARIPKGWDNYGIFNRDVLQPAMDDINKYTDIKINYQGLKTDSKGIKYRKVVRIQFVMLPKTEGERRETYRTIDSEYQVYKDQNVIDEKPLTLEEEFIESDRRKREAEELEKARLEKEEARKEYEKLLKEKEKSISECRCPLLAELLYDDIEGNIRNIENIYFEACMHLVPGQIEVRNRDAWAEKYVRHYFRKITESEETTRTSFYTRLLDTVIKDYDSYAERIIEFNKD